MLPIVLWRKVHPLRHLRDFMMRNFLMLLLRSMSGLSCCAVKCSTTELWTLEMNLSISYNSKVEAVAFPFLFLEASLALGAINGYEKIKSNAFTTPNLKCLLVLEQKKKKRMRRRREGQDGGV